MVGGKPYPGLWQRRNHEVLAGVLGWMIHKNDLPLSQMRPKRDHHLFTSYCSKITLINIKKEVQSHSKTKNRGFAFNMAPGDKAKAKFFAIIEDPKRYDTTCNTLLIEERKGCQTDANLRRLQE